MSDHRDSETSTARRRTVVCAVLFGCLLFWVILGFAVVAVLT